MPGAAMPSSLLTRTLIGPIYRTGAGTGGRTATVLLLSGWCCWIEGERWSGYEANAQARFDAQQLRQANNRIYCAQADHPLGHCRLLTLPFDTMSKVTNLPLTKTLLCTLQVNATERLKGPGARHGR